MDATDAVTTMQSYKQIAAVILGSEEKKDPVKEVVLWLQQTDEEWLLVFDNAPVTSLAKYLPDGDHGNILYTSRQHNLQPRLRPECVATIDTMDAPEAILLLLRSAQKPTDIAETRESARSIVMALGLLPLAIDQAGAYIHMAPCPLEEYLGVFNEQKEVLLRSPRFKGSDEKRHIAVYATFNISYRAIKAFADKKEDLARVKDAQTALKLLNLVCFFHNEGPIGMLFGEAAKNRYKLRRIEDYPLKAGQVELESLIETFETDTTRENPDGREWFCAAVVGGLGFLNEFSLLKFDVSVDYINMHILVHDWARNRMDDNEKSHWGVVAKSLVMDSTRGGSGVQGVQWRRDALPHVEACWKNVKAEHEDSALESEYLGKAARVFEQADNLGAAEAMLLKALEYRKTYFGLLHEGPLMAMAALGRLYLKQAKYDDAEEILLELVDRHTLYLKDLKWQAFLEAHVTTADEAEHQKSVLDAYDPLDDRSLRIYKMRLVAVFTVKDNSSATADIYEEFLRWSEAKFGKQSKEARRWRNKAHMARQLTFEDFAAFEAADRKKDITIEEAREKLESAVAELGDNHHATIGAKKQLAEALMEQRAYKEAFMLLWQVKLWSERLYGEQSVRHMDAIHALGQLYSDEGRLYDAADFLNIAFVGYCKKLGPTHSSTLATMIELAMISASKAEYQQAIEIVEACLDGCQVTLGPDHRITKIGGHLLSQFRHYETTIPDYIRVAMKNHAIQSNKDAGGELAPQWMQDWTPNSVEAMVQERLDRGEAVHSFRTKQYDIEGWPMIAYELVRRNPEEREAMVITRQ